MRSAVCNYLVIDYVSCLFDLCNGKAFLKVFKYRKHLQISLPTQPGLDLSGLRVPAYTSKGPLVSDEPANDEATVDRGNEVSRVVCEKLFERS